MFNDLIIYLYNCLIEIDSKYLAEFPREYNIILFLPKKYNVLGHN